MTEQEIKTIVTRQRKYFQTGSTLPVNTRLNALRRLYAAISGSEKEIHEALKKDLGKSGFESYMCETGLVLEEISYMLKHTARFTREKRVRTPLAQFHSRSFQKPSPYGVTLIMSPWNYPFMLTLSPLVDALAAGNTAVVKPSAYSPNTSEVLRKILSQCFEPQYVAVVTGGRAENTCLLHEHFDYIFFTGSQAVGKEVMRNAAEYLTPVTLELGGKSPCIVDQTADIRLAARRVVFGKYLNCGQTCVAPDYIYCQRSVKDAFIKEVQKQIRKQYGRHPLDNPDYGKIINEKHFDRILGLIDEKKVVQGGGSDRKTLRIEPTVMDNVAFSDPVMQEEIFGPVMPILTFDSIDEVIHRVNAMPHPLALYLFTSDKKTEKKVISRCGFGGGCINDTIIHLATTEMGFGGFGESGMGAYHGKTGFDTFTHYKSIVDKKTWLDLPMRYQPYRKLHEKMVRFFLK
ncbi:aldehyde dehydrogenase [Mediterraneibacter glycyrrhizinilyticus]|uniref:aldehyde dehydrogenase n=1 Tax=Mediterraneibacter glycyrrhizinilyticus TaxID=342942 RepID=UPI001960F8B7|nr:aldehyde dehydrogenase [Mediterraneibacter glycyrrhizinilyticus]MBM6751887.1 aldehyde dehydrogenase [Mediterraneibacter glycyrrhizinilyticus]